MSCRPLRSLTLLCASLTLVGCADVEHLFARMPNDQLAWRLRISPHEPLGVPAKPVLDAIQALAPREVRVWQDPNADLVLQGHFADLERYHAFAEAGLATLAELGVPVHVRHRPPRVDLDASSAEVWRLDHPVAEGPGRWVLRLDAPTLSGRPDHKTLDGIATWTVEPGASRRITATASGAPPPSLAGFLLQGGPSLAAALAGLGLLMWVNRRTRRKALRGAT